MCREIGSLVAVLVFANVVHAADTPPKRFPSPVSPEESLQHFQLDPELRIEIVAAEPEILDPVAIAFDADGSLWVVEMRDYPHGPKPGEKPQSAIKHLFDKDGDGRYETATTFADELLFCTGVLPYRDGLIVTLAGQIAFFSDRDGDGQAEFRETWFSGFAQENSQLRANHPTYGPDGYVYVANGLRGGKIVAERPQWKKTGEPLSIQGFDFRFHPETGEFAAVTGHGQFGLCFDDYGRRFICSNRNPCMQVMLENWYIQRNPQFAPKKVVHDICAAAENSRLYPISEAWTTSTLHANQFTAACGVTIYRGNALPNTYRGNVFTCDPTGNLVHREVLSPDGATFQGTSPYEGREFLSSPDVWFRPVSLADGPDGALYVVDMYRAVIEHPDFMPAELKNRLDLRLGTDRGRIYRITSQGAASRSMSQGTRLTHKELVQLLSSDNGWARDTAIRLLTENAAADAIPELLASLRNAQTSDQGLVAALWTLQRLKALTPDIVKDCFDQHRDNPGVQENIIRLAEPWLDDRPDLRDLVKDRLAGSRRTAFQAMLSLSAGELDHDVALRLAQSAIQHPDDPWLNAALVLAARGSALAVLGHMVSLSPNARTSPTSVIEALTERAVMDQPPQELEPLLRALAHLDCPHALDSQLAFLRGYGRGSQRRGTAWELALANLPDGGQTIRDYIQRWLLAAANLSRDTTRSLENRVAAIHTLRWASPQLGAQVLLPFVTNNSETALAVASCESLAMLPGDDVAPALLNSFPSAVPSVRRAILDALLAHPGRVRLLLEAVERAVDEQSPGTKAPGSSPVVIRPAEIDPANANRLLNYRDAELRQRAKQLLTAGSADRAAVIAQYQPAIQTLGDPARGKAVFARHCVTCHRIAGMGVNVGADIGDTRDKTPSYLLTAILDPNRAVDNNYFGYAVATKEGKTFTGIIAAETPTSITLRQAEGKTETILRTEIEELRTTGQSFMPVGFEKNISVDEMSDLVSFLKNWRYLDGAVPTGVGAR